MRDSDEDLLGLQSLHPDMESAAAVDQQTTSANVVELGSSLDTAAESASRGRMKQSPVTRLVRTSIVDEDESRSHKRRGARAGEKPYQGRMPLRHQQQPAKQQQQNQSQQQQQQYRRGSAPWAQEIRTVMRRRSRDGAEMVRRRVSMTSDSMRRRLSQTGNDHDSELQRLRDEERMRQRDDNDEKNGNMRD